MQIPQTNINAYRRQYGTNNNIVQVPIILLNENIRNQRNIGSHYALLSGSEDEGSIYRGYGCYRSDAPDTCCTVYCPIYYNRKSSVNGGNEWFL